MKSTTYFLFRPSTSLSREQKIDQPQVFTHVAHIQLQIVLTTQSTSAMCRRIPGEESVIIRLPCNLLLKSQESLSPSPYSNGRLTSKIPIRQYAMSSILVVDRGEAQNIHFAMLSVDGSPLIRTPLSTPVMFTSGRTSQGLLAMRVHVPE